MIIDELNKRKYGKNYKKDEVAVETTDAVVEVENDEATENVDNKKKGLFRRK